MDINFLITYFQMQESNLLFQIEQFRKRNSQSNPEAAKELRQMTDDLENLRYKIKALSKVPLHHEQVSQQ